MLLAIDVGNTHSLFALCLGGQVRHSWRIASDPHRTEDEYASWLQGLMHCEDIAMTDVTDVILSSVVPDTVFALRRFAEKYCKAQAFVVGKDTASLGMPVLIDQPAELGADRLVNAFAAWYRHQRSAIVIDFGTATTFDVISEKGEYLGGVIAPGVNLSIEALSRAAAKLPAIPIRQPNAVIGTNTTHAMQSGVYYGYLGMVNEIIAQIQAQQPSADFVVATGGLAELYSRDNAKIHQVEPDLTINGLMQIYAQKRQQKVA